LPQNVHHSNHVSDCTMLERPPVLQVPVEVIAAEVRNERMVCLEDLVRRPVKQITFFDLAVRLFVVAMFLAVSVKAQFTSNVQGFVLDPSGAVLVGATVSLRNSDTGVQKVMKTGDSGNYRFSSLPPGDYVISAEAGGFKKAEVSFTLSTGETQGIDVHLAVATAAAAVKVTAEAAPLNVDESRIQATLSADTVRDLPQLNRNIYDVLAVTPGVVGTGTRGPGEADADWDVRQRFLLSGTYTFPGLNSGVGKAVTSGWELTSIAAIHTGTPFWVICSGAPSCDYNNDGLFYDIPNQPSTNFTGSHSGQAYINGIFSASDFPVPAVGTEGNLRRNIYGNPGLAQVDASVLKNNRVPWLGEQGNLQFRFDFLNVFNHVNLGSVDNNLVDATFGRVTSALSARQIQLGLRISF